MINKIFSMFGPKNYTGMGADEFETAIKQDKNAVVLDVRTPNEFRSGHIPGAKNINFMGGDFSGAVSKLDPEKTYYVYCRSGGRSSSACGLMASKGFQKLVNMEGGIMAYSGKLVS